MSRAPQTLGGTPGVADTHSLPDSVVINEVLAHSDETYGTAGTIVGFGQADSGWRNARESSDLLVQILDDGPSADCGIVGQWTSAGTGFRGDSCRSEPGTGADTVSWDFAVLPGQYTVAATWSAAEDLAVVAPFAVFDSITPWVR